MEVKGVVKIAKSHIADVFSDEIPNNIGSEEITFSDDFEAYRFAWRTGTGTFVYLVYYLPEL